jgi:hypothetical protein
MSTPARTADVIPAPPGIMLNPGPGVGRRYREPRTRWLPAHQKRAGLGVWAANRSHAARVRIKRWKQTRRLDPAALGEFSAAVTDLIRAWSPILPPGTVLTVPPQGASAPGPYAGESLEQAVAGALGLPFVEVLSRTEPKLWHGPHASLRQAPYVCALPDPAPPMVLVVDDLYTSGRTMRHSIEAIRATGAAAFGFAYSGC